MISTSVANEKPPSIKCKNVLIDPFPCKKLQKNYHVMATILVVITYG